MFLEIRSKNFRFWEKFLKKIFEKFFIFFGFSPKIHSISENLAKKENR